jgi:ABC-type amino acid transport substrate-binding protein
MFDALKANRIDAVGYDNHTISYFLAQPAFRRFQSTVPYAPAGISCGSIAFRKNARDLRDAFNREQRKLAAMGGFDAILRKWATPAESVRLARGKTAAGVCGR